MASNAIGVIIAAAFEHEVQMNSTKGGLCELESLDDFIKTAQDALAKVQAERRQFETVPNNDSVTPSEDSLNKTANSNGEHVIDTVAPHVELENGKPVVSFYFSSALLDESDGLNQVLAFARDVCASDNDEVTLSINVGLENILDGALDLLRYQASPRNGKYHLSEDYRGHIEILKKSIRRALDKLDNVHFHGESPKFDDA